MARKTTTSKAVSFRVEGLKELQKSLKALEDVEGQAPVKAAFKRAADEVVDRSRRRASTRMERSMAGRLKPSVAKLSAGVVIGGKPYDFGAEFGASQNVPRSTRRGTVLGWNQFKPTAGQGTEAGYVVHPSARDTQDWLAGELGSAIEAVWDGSSGRGSSPSVEDIFGSGFGGI